jgi:hypothetical protein
MMAKIKFIEHSFSDQSVKIISLANGILNEYRSKGYRLTLRQLYYQLVARGYIENSIRSYKRIGDLMSNARLSGLIDWSMIEDRGRETVGPRHWENPAQIIRSAAEQFKIDKWVDQPCYCEVMVEKDALSGILIPVCMELDIKFNANKGYSSSSAMYEAGQRFDEAGHDGKELHLFYLGDHDPSGIDMTRDITDRIDLFCYGRDIEVHRLALNMDQVNEWNPPKNPAKETDARFAGYVREFGHSSWELDAVKPEDLVDLVKNEVENLIDFDLWDEAVGREKVMLATLEKFANDAEGKKN